jgi:hypothetical protein
MTTGALQQDDNNQTGALTGPQQQAVEANPEPEVVTKPEPVADSPEDKKNFIGRMVSKGKEFWERGKDDPATKAREDKTEQVTSFMGGMTRQELGMFVFQWGGMMMANSDKGLGAAAGEAGLGALAGHQGRQTAAQEKEEAKAQQIIENQLAKQKADAGTMTAEAAKQRADAYVKHAASGGGNLKDAFLIDFYRSQGKTDKWITERISGAKSEGQVFDIVSEDVGQMVAKAKADPPFTDDEAVMIDHDDNPQTPDVALHKMTPSQEAAYAKVITNERLKARGSLGSGALESTRPAEDYLP